MWIFNWFKRKPRPAYRIRVVTLNNGKTSFYPEYTSGKFSPYLAVADINGCIETIESAYYTKPVSSETKARTLIARHIKAQQIKRAKEIKEQTIINVA